MAELTDKNLDIVAKQKYGTSYDELCYMRQGTIRRLVQAMETEEVLSKSLTDY